GSSLVLFSVSLWFKFSEIVTYAAEAEIRLGILPDHDPRVGGRDVSAHGPADEHRAAQDRGEAGGVSSRRDPAGRGRPRGLGPQLPATVRRLFADRGQRADATRRERGAAAVQARRRTAAEADLRRLRVQPRLPREARPRLHA